MTSGVMDKFVHPLLRMGKFVHRMGVVPGIVAYRRVARNQHLPQSSEIYSVSARGYPQPLWLRGGHSDGLIFGQVIIDLQYNLPQIDQVRLIVDCGANVGFSALYFARRYPQAKILAIEPDPGNYAMLVRNTQSVAAIRPIHAAVWPRKANLSIVDPARPHAALRVTEGQGKGPGNIPTVQLADIVAEHSSIDILKVDIEGSEKALFEDPSSPEWLSKTRVIYAELHDWMEPGSSRAFYQAITRFPFSQQHQGEIIAIELHHPSSS